VSALLKARIVTSEIKLWADEDVFEMRKAEIEVLINQALEDSGDALFAPLTKVLPIGVTLREVLSYLQAETDEQRSELKNAFVKRLGEDALETPSPKVRVMSMHGAKGLSASVVFIPGLEDDWLPGPHRSSYPRLLSEAARLLYVAITRARVACVISLADRRVIHGQSELRIPSRLASDFGLPFVRAVGNIFSQSEILRVIKDNIDRKME
jgi:DNA helicase-2/ATP-dependent DNA helicase PcrA